MNDQHRAIFPAMVNRLADLSPDSAFGQWFEDNLPVMEERLTIVKDLLAKPVNDLNFNMAINAIHFMVDKFPLMITRLEPDAPIFRARPNYGELFSEQQDISYNKKCPERILAGRFNRPMEPLFYGALRVDNPQTNHVLSSALESCKELIDVHHPPEVQDLTVGQWLTTDLVPVVNLCFDSRHLEGNEMLRKSAEQYEAEMRSFFSPEATAFIFKFMQFFSELSRSTNQAQPNAYYILNAFFYAVRYYYANSCNTAIPGVIYPGMMSEARGLNIVLVPQAVDRFLKLNRVMMQRFSLAPGTKTFTSMPCSALLTPVNGRFQFHNVPPYRKNGVLIYYTD